jgi:1-aminocyclopropane-1-carboxylate deaminase
MLANVNSPLCPLKHFSRTQIQVKRDDLIDPYVSGNKWRKLKYTLEKARELNKNHIVTFGGAYSNHLVATAAACARQGFACTAFVRGEHVENEMLVLCKLFGMELIFTERELYRNKLSLFNAYFSNVNNTYFVDEGGASIEAVKGCAEIIDELIVDCPQGIDHLFCAAGTGTTAAGLLKGIHSRGLKTILHVIPALKSGAFIADEISKYTGHLTQLQIHTDYHFGGYAKTTPQLIEYIKRFTREEGMLIDPVYTSKMFYAIDDLQQKQHFGQESNIVALHTGGLLGIMGMKEKF